MESQNKAEIQRAFSRQAQNFENGKMNFTNREYLDYAVSKISPKASDIVLEAAAGTCACGRAVARYAKSVVCLDMTPEMLSIGRAKAAEEKLRDNSHIRNLSKAEMLGLFGKHGLSVECCETVKMPIKLENRLEHSSAPEAVQAEIISRMKEDISGGTKTGFNPYINDSDIYFDHRWVLISEVKD